MNEHGVIGWNPLPEYDGSCGFWFAVINIAVAKIDSLLEANDVARK